MGGFYISLHVTLSGQRLRNALGQNLDASYNSHDQTRNYAGQQKEDEEAYLLLG